MIERTGIIEVGDVVVNHAGEVIKVIRVEIGKHGILYEGAFISPPYPYSNARGYFPYELPPVEVVQRWFGWHKRATTVLANGLGAGVVTFGRSDPRPRTIEEYDAEWERTLASIAEENANGTGSANLMQSKPLPDMPGVMK